MIPSLVAFCSTDELMFYAISIDTFLLRTRRDEYLRRVYGTCDGHCVSVRIHDDYVVGPATARGPTGVVCVRLGIRRRVQIGRFALHAVRVRVRRDFFDDLQTYGFISIRLFLGFPGLTWDAFTNARSPKRDISPRADSDASTSRTASRPASSGTADLPSNIRRTYASIVPESGGKPECSL